MPAGAPDPHVDRAARGAHTAAMPRQPAPLHPPELAPPAGAALDDWNLLRSFIAVYECGTLTQAARQLGATQPNLGRHVRALEKALGETLFVRRPGRLEPTERAHALYGVTAPMKASAQEAGRLLAQSGAGPTGTVRIAVSEVYAAHVVAPLVAQCQILALLAFQAAGCRGVSRIDFRVTPEGQPFVLEINTIPGFTATSLLPKAAAKKGLSFSALCARLLTYATCD